MKKLEKANPVQDESCHRQGSSYQLTRLRIFKIYFQSIIVERKR